MSNYTPRTEAPSTSNTYYYADNPFYQSGYGLPNCTCYAWGRFWEIGGSRPTLSTRDAELWWGNTADGYERGQTPRLGAVACWRRGSVDTDDDGAGHVAIVESINGDTITTSNSAYNSTLFYTKTLTKSDGWTWNSDYVFQGFIYHPSVGQSSTTLEWIVGNRALKQSEMENNAAIIRNYLVNEGWTLNAIAGLLGNMEHESTINPQRWQSGDYGNMSGGFGLVQWTPASKYIEWAGSDWETNHNKQLQRLIWEMNNNEQYYSTSNYPESFRQFSQSTKTPYYLACAFVYNYERSYVALYGSAEEKAAMEKKRGNAAEAWYTYILNLPSGGGVPDGPNNPGFLPADFPLWLLFKLKGVI